MLWSYTVRVYVVILDRFVQSGRFTSRIGLFWIAVYTVVDQDWLLMEYNAKDSLVNEILANQK